MTATDVPVEARPRKRALPYLILAAVAFLALSYYFATIGHPLVFPLAVGAVVLIGGYIGLFLAQRRVLRQTDASMKKINASMQTVEASMQAIDEAQRAIREIRAKTEPEDEDEDHVVN